MIDKMREEFEAWHRSVVEGEPPHEKYNSGDYRNQQVQRYWLGWQASRAALVIELPPVRPEPIASGDELKSDGEAASWNIWVGEKLAKADCREAIEAAGLKVKP